MAEKERILVMNLGSTSSKIAVYDEEEEVFKETIRHTKEEMAQFDGVIDQFEFRRDKIYESLKRNGISTESLTAVCSRGGKLLPCPHGAIEIDREMVDYLIRPDDTYPHASLLGSLVAFDLKQQYGIPACIYDAIGSDEMQPIARVTGIPEIPRFTVGHTLNTRAMGMKCAEEILCRDFEECTLIVAHLGGGSSIRLYRDGVNIDSINDDEGNFTPERCGGINAKELLNYCWKCFEEGQNVKEVGKKLQGNAGLMAHLGTADAIEIEKMIAEGNDYAKIVYDAMAYRIAKDIGTLAVPVAGKVDRIVLTGGIAHSKRLTENIVKLVSWIAPVEIMAGEYEMEALAAGALRVLRGEEALQNFGRIKASVADRIRIYPGIRPYSSEEERNTSTLFSCS